MKFKLAILAILLTGCFSSCHHVFVWTLEDVFTLIGIGFVILLLLIVGGANLIDKLKGK